MLKYRIIFLLIFLINLIPLAADSQLIFILPGMNKTGTEREYSVIGDAFRSKGIQPVVICPEWKEVDRSQWENDISRQIEDYLSQHPDCVYSFFGHSIGGAMAMILAERWNPEAVIVCSPSPIFEGDLGRLPASRSFWIKAFVPDDFTPRSYPDILPEQTIFFYGSNDSRLISIHNIAFRTSLYSNCETRIILNASHRLAGRKYLRAVVDYINGME